MKSLIFSSIILLFVPALTYAQAKRNCTVTFKISGERADGKGNFETEMDVTERCYDFDAAALKKQLADDKSRYGEHDYQFISNPTQKQDCAGYTFQKLFNKGPFWITAQKFYDHLLIMFGKQVRSLTDPFGWGDVREGDVLIYRQGAKVNHITYVSQVNTTLGVVSSVVIDTKDGKEGVYKHKIGLMNNQTDPLIRAMGEIRVYRLDPSKIKITEIERTCDCDISGAGWVLESLVIDPDKKSGKWSETHDVTITENGVTARAYNSKLGVTVTSPPKFIKDGEEAPFEITTSYEGADDQVHIGISFNAYGGLTYSQVGNDGALTSGKITAHKFQRNSTNGTFKVKRETFGYSETGTISVQVFINPYNVGPRIFEAKYKRKEK